MKLHVKVHHLISCPCIRPKVIPRSNICSLLVSGVILKGLTINVLIGVGLIGPSFITFELIVKSVSIDIVSGLFVWDHEVERASCTNARAKDVGGAGRAQHGGLGEKLLPGDGGIFDETVRIAASLPGVEHQDWWRNMLLRRWRVGPLRRLKGGSLRRLKSGNLRGLKGRILRGLKGGILRCVKSGILRGCMVDILRFKVGILRRWGVG